MTGASRVDPGDDLEPGEIPPNATTVTIEHQIGFYETDAMTVVHHANYLHFLERARMRWLEEHDQPYPLYVEQDIHFAVTRVAIDYHRSARFNDVLNITTWMCWVRGASLRMAYRVEARGELILSGYTEHAAISTDGRVRRIPRKQRERLRDASLIPDRDY